MEPIKLTGANGRTITVRNDCMGAPNCAAEIVIERGVEWLDVHLSDEDTKQLVRALKRARREWKKERKEAGKARILAGQQFSVDLVDTVTDQPVALLVYGDGHPDSYTITLPATNDTLKCRSYRVVFRVGD